MMKMTKRILAFLLILILSFSSLTVIAEEAPAFEPGEHLDTISFLRALGIIDETFTLNSSSVIVTRGEFAKVISEVMLLGGSASFDATFTDVPSSHEYAPYIYAVKSAGYMNGTSADRFSPDEPIYHEQAVSVCVKIAGYDEVAKSMGSYPECYLTQASKLGLLENIISETGIPMSRGNLVELIYNTVLCDMMIITGYGENGSYAIYEGENILTWYHKIKKSTGIVTADNYYTMTSNHTGDKDAVIIDGIRYYKNDMSVLRDSVGRCVEFYYRDEGNRKTVLYAEKYETTEIIFNIDENLELNTQNGITYIHHTKNKATLYKLTDNCDVIYNMEELIPVTTAKLLPQAGRVTLIDNTGDGRYDVVIVDEYYNLIVDMYNKTLNTISDALDNSRSLNLDDITTYRIFDKGSNEITPDKIKPKSIIEVYKSASGENLTAIVSSAVVSGKYTERSDSGVIKVEGTEYKISADVRENVSNLTLGNEYDFYINSKSEIVYWTQGSGLKQGYILDVGQSGTMDKKVSVKLLSQNGKVEIFDLADKVKNVSYASAVTVDKMNFASIFQETNYREFILYQLTDDNKIHTITHAMQVHDHDTLSNLPSYPIFRLDHYAENWEAMNGQVVGGELLFRKGINGFDNMLIFSEDARVYRVPSVTNPSVDEKNVSVTPVNTTFNTDDPVTFTNNYQGASGTMITYMVGGSYPFANVMIQHAGGSASSVGKDQESVTVTSIRNTYDKDTMEEAYFMEVWNGENMLKVYISDENQLSRSAFENTTIDGKTAAEMPTATQKTKIEVGDVIKYTTDEAGNLKSLALMYDCRNDILCYSTAGFGSQYNLSAGKVIKIRNTFMEAEIPWKTFDSDGNITGQGTRWEIMDISTLPTLVYDFEKDRIYVGTSLDIEVGDTVVRYSKSSSLRHIIVYKR